MRAYSPLLLLFVAAGCADHRSVADRERNDAVAANSAVARTSPPALESVVPTAVAVAHKELAGMAARAPVAPLQDNAQVAQRKLIRSANLRVEVPRVDSAMRLVDAAVRSHEAVVANAQVSQIPRSDAMQRYRSTSPQTDSTKHLPSFDASERSAMKTSRPKMSAENTPTSKSVSA